MSVEGTYYANELNDQIKTCKNSCKNFKSTALYASLSCYQDYLSFFFFLCKI